MTAANVSYVCNFKLPSSHIKKKKKQNEEGEIGFNTIFCLTQYTKNIIILTCNQHKRLLVEYFAFFFFILSL